MARKLFDVSMLIAAFLIGIGGTILASIQATLAAHTILAGVVFVLIGVIVTPFISSAFWLRLPLVGRILFWGCFLAWLVAGIGMSWVYAERYVQSGVAILPSGVPVSQSVAIIALSPYVLIFFAVAYISAASYRYQMDMRQRIVLPESK